MYIFDVLFKKRTKEQIVIIESFRLPFTVNGNGEKRHKISRDTLNGQRLR